MRVRGHCPPSNVKGLRSSLLAWYRANKRDLPWRQEIDAYRVWISEIMLQQTRVDTVIPYYAAFVARWPDVSTLAAASPDDVRAAWSGLGYYRRAKLMMAAADAIMRVHEGKFPSTAAELKALPGFGRYTAGAVASIAFAEETPAIDGNVERVLARILGLETDPRTALGAKAIFAMAQALVKGQDPGGLNQALMELGALVCTPRSPRCVACPAAKACNAYLTERTHAIPPPRIKKPSPTIALTAVVVVIDADVDARVDARVDAESGALIDAPANALIDAQTEAGSNLSCASVVLERQPESGLFAGLHTVPLLPGHLSTSEVSSMLRQRFGWVATGCIPVDNVKHILTHRTLDMNVMRVEGVRGVMARDSGLTAIPLDQLGRVGVPSATVRVLSAGLPPALRAITRFPGRRTVTRKSARSPEECAKKASLGPRASVRTEKKLRP
ncbi:MAG: A/G-specific adenine glycosylase [Deltaproteobacteria bacterium]|nr:A/G-specific adenine glycosylase [Deltaproteobacteria bacterium]